MVGAQLSSWGYGCSLSAEPWSCPKTTANEMEGVRPFHRTAVVVGHEAWQQAHDERARNYSIERCTINKDKFLEQRSMISQYRQDKVITTKSMVRQHEMIGKQKENIRKTNDKRDFVIE